jgi:methionine-rich copper-binding protein CopC
MDSRSRRTRCQGTGAVRLVAIVALSTLALAAPAAVLAAPAGTELLGTMPAADEARDRPPEVARAVFATPVEPGDPALEVRDENGRRVDEGDAGAGPSAAVIEVSLPEDLPAGGYEATWRAVSPDGEPLDGSWTFTILEDPAGEGTGRTGLVALAVLVLVLAAVAVWLARRHLADDH